jgi:hypothetical protein
MKNVLAFLIATQLIFAGLPSAGRNDEKAPANRAEADKSGAPNEKAIREKAAELIDRLALADYKAAVGMFDPVLAKRMPGDKLRATWESVVARCGPFHRQVGAKVKVRPTGGSVLVTCAFEKRRHDARIVFNETGSVSFLAFLPIPLGGPGLIRASESSWAGPSTEGAVGTLTFPVPGTYRDQVPLSFSVTCQPPVALKGYRWRRRDDGLNWLCEVTVAPPKNGAVVRWESVVLVDDHKPVNLPAAPKPEVPEEAKRWTLSTGCVQSKDTDICAKAQELAKGVTDVGEYARRVNHFVATNPLRMNQFWKLDARSALSCGGSCTSRANLGAALLRARGIPARTVAHLPTWSGPLYEHWLVEYWHPGVGWVWLETSLNQVQPPSWSLVVLNVANPEDEDLAFAPVRKRGVVRGAPNLSVIERSPELTPQLSMSLDPPANDAIPEVALDPANQELRTLFKSARQAYASLAERAQAGTADAKHGDKLVIAAERGGLKGLLEALGTLSAAKPTGSRN